MRKQQSAGAVVFSQKRQQFLLLKHREGRWEFPKGKLQPKETDEDALERELEEETGIRSFERLSFTRDVTYTFWHRGRINKRVRFFLILSDDPVRISEEHQAFGWFSYEEAIEALSHKDIRAVLVEAYQLLMREGRLR